MLASYNWLKEYCESKLDPDTMAAKFTAAGLEVTSVTPVNQPVAELYIGIIDKIEKHPNADKLSLVSVTTGRKQYSVVCGAPNIQEKQKILLAAPGAVLPGNFKIKKTKIRGVASSGMICSREELGLEEKSSGIWVLPEKAQLSDSPAQYIGQPDYIFDIDLTSNRGDCLSIIGIARELSAITGNYLSYKEPKKYPNRTGNINIKVTAPEKCPRYTARLVRNVRISASPEWLRRRLYLHNIRPINNVVDITNLVLLEYGQPLHAFDYNKINGKKINVRTADKGESIKTLDEQEHTLDNEDLVICDARRPIALAGIMGGENTGIDNNTSDILIESAWFDPLTIRKTSKKHKISSDSSIRFEKGVDISKVTDALNYCAGLIRQLAGGEIVSSVKDIYPQKHTRREIILKYSKINRYLGCSLDKNEIINILTRLDFKIKHNDKEQVQLLAPLSRHDVVYEWDVIEEIGRIYGYNKLPEKLPYISNSTMQIEAQAENSFQEAAAGLGYNQCINFSFLDNSYIKKALPDTEKLVKIANPVNSNTAYLRPDLLYGLLGNVKTNLDHQVKEQSKIFEIGRVFTRADHRQKHTEKKTIGFLGYGPVEKPNWTTPERSFDFYDLSGDIAAFINDKERLTLNPEPNSLFEPQWSAAVIYAEQKIGIAGKVKQNILDYFDIKRNNIFFAELDLVLPAVRTHKVKRFTPFSPYPSVYRDIALVTAKDYDISGVASLIKNSSKEVVDITISNIYSGRQIGPGKKSVVFAVEYCSMEKTLLKEDVDWLEKQICDKILSSHPVELR